ncbi:KilA-N domain-containing protein, partial [Klebsiella pneumoniae]
MIENNVIPFHYQGQAVRFNSEGWINATDVAKRFGKRPVDWLKQDETKQYMGVLAEALNCDPESLLETR